MRAGLTRCVHAIVALTASADDAGMIKLCASPRNSCVAGIAFGRGRDMRRRLSTRRRTIVTT